MKSTVVAINDTSATLLAKGPGRFRFASTYAEIVLGGADVTAANGWPCVVSDEFVLNAGEKCFTVAIPLGVGPGNVVVLSYGSP